MLGLPRSLPYIGYHEFAGTVVSQSHKPSIEAWALKVRARVGLLGRSFYACGKFFKCRNERVEDPVAKDDGGYSVNCTLQKTLD